MILKGGYLRTYILRMNTTMDLKDSLTSDAEASDHNPAPESGDTTSVEKIHLDPAFIQEVESLDSLEKQIDRLFQFLDTSMGAKPPKFRDFWEGRKMLLPLLKQVNPAVRTPLWERLSLITQEARRKKDELVKESSFAEEQIEMAITSLEKEMAGGQNQPLSADQLFSSELGLFADQKDALLDLQNQLNALNTFATRITSLRKELIRTNIRIKTKNQFFERLSTLGNGVFPKRKELIQAVSDQFAQEVSSFCQSTKKELSPRQQLALLREQIKEFQKLAKIFTLNTNAFNATRSELSSLWDLVKDQEKERKKEIAQRKEESSQQKNELLDELEAIKGKLEANELTARNAEEKLNTLLSLLKRQKLDKFHTRDIKEKILAVKEPIDRQLAAEAEAFNIKEREKEENRLLEVNSLKEKLHQLSISIPATPIDAIEESVAEYKKKRQELTCTSAEKRDFDQVFKAIQSLIADKREEALLNLPSAEKEYLENLLTVKKQREERRKEVKARLEALRKSKASSGLDFEKALLIDAQEQEERESLEKIVQGIQEIDQKIAAFKAKK